MKVFQTKWLPLIQKATTIKTMNLLVKTETWTRNAWQGRTSTICSPQHLVLKLRMSIRQMSLSMTHGRWSLIKLFCDKLSIYQHRRRKEQSQIFTRPGLIRGVYWTGLHERNIWKNHPVNFLSKKSYGQAVFGETSRDGFKEILRYLCFDNRDTRSERQGDKLLYICKFFKCFNIQDCSIHL